MITDSGQYHRKTAVIHTIANQHLLPATSTDPDEPVELLIVEGQSALHAIDSVRRRRDQAVFSMQGKLPNAAVRPRARVLAHEPIQRLITVLGVGVESDCDPALLRFNRIRVLAEADADGQHAAWLLLQFFRRYLAPLLATGVFGIIQAPLARVEGANGTRFLWNDNEKRRYLDCLDALDHGTITVFKGIASLSTADRYFCLIDSATRREHLVNADPDLPNDSSQT